jgi:hypothetical protein
MFPDPSSRRKMPEHVIIVNFRDADKGAGNKQQSERDEKKVGFFT